MPNHPWRAFLDRARFQARIWQAWRLLAGWLAAPQDLGERKRETGERFRRLTSSPGGDGR